MNVYPFPSIELIKYRCPSCNTYATVTKADNGNCMCTNCSAETRPPMAYLKALLVYQARLPGTSIH